MKYYSYREIRDHFTGGLPLAYYPVDLHSPRYEMMYHWHKEYELIHIIEGSFSLTADGNTFLLNKGDVAVISPGVLHGGTPHNAIYECLVFSPDAITLNTKEEYKKRRLIPKHITVNFDLKEFAPKIKPHILAAFETVKTSKSGFELNFYCEILSLFSIIMDNGLFEKRGDLKASRVSKLIPLENVINYIEENFSQQISLEDMAKSAGFSRKYFSEYFKKLIGKSPGEYLNSYRIERAADMLLNTDLSVTEIAFSCGFNDLSYFIKTFKDLKFATPGKYRKQ